jgi:putative copper resistance protein D
LKEYITFALVVVHVLTAIAWVGGALFIALVMVPVSRGMEPPGLGLRFVRLAAVRFRGLAWGLLLTMVVSGAILLELRDIGFARWDESEFWRTDLGRVLLTKYVLVALLLALSAIHDFVLGPRVAAALDGLVPGAPRPAGVMATRRKMLLLARLNMLLALAVVITGLMILRGIPG